MTRIVWPRPHSISIPVCGQEGPCTVRPAVLAASEPGPLKVAGFVAGGTLGLWKDGSGQAGRFYSWFYSRWRAKGILKV